MTQGFMNGEIPPFSCKNRAIILDEKVNSLVVHLLIIQNVPLCSYMR